MKVLRSILITVSVLTVIMLLSSSGPCSAQSAEYLLDDNSISISSKYLNVDLVDSTSHTTVANGSVFRDDIYVGTDIQLFNDLSVSIGNGFGIDEDIVLSVAIQSSSDMTEMNGAVFTAEFSSSSGTVSGSGTHTGGTGITITAGSSVSSDAAYWTVELSIDEMDTSVDYTGVTVTVSAVSASYSSSAVFTGNELKISSTVVVYSGSDVSGDFQCTGVQLYSEASGSLSVFTENLNLPRYVQHYANVSGTDYYVECDASDVGSMEVISVGSGLLNGNTDVEAISIPDSVAFIGRSFVGCTNLRYLSIPDSITSIHPDAFSGLTLTDYSGTAISSSMDLAGRSFFGIGGTLKQCTSSLTYSLDSEGKAEVSSSGNEPTIVIPDHVLYGTDLVEVSSIGESAFAGKTDIISVRVSGTIVAIGSSAFSGCSSLEAIVYEASTDCSIGANAFNSCSSLRYVEFPTSDCTVSSDAFSVLFFDTDREQIGTSEYTGLSRNVFTGNGGGKLYQSSTGIVISGSDVILNGDPGSTLSIPYCSFNGVSVQNITGIGSMNGANAHYSKVNLTENIVTIDAAAFMNVTTLERVLLYDSITTIGNYAFEGCTGIRSIYISSGLTSLGTGAFTGLSFFNSSGSSIAVSGDNLKGRMFSGSGDANLYEPTSGVTYTVSGGVAEVSKIPKVASVRIAEYYKSGGILYPVTKIGNDAARSNTTLTSIILPETISVIGSYAFSSCSSGTSFSIVLPDSVTEIGPYAFYYCRAVSITMGDGVEIIGESAFESCINLTTLVIGSSVTTMGDHAFANNSKLVNVTIRDGAETIGEYAFYNCSKLSAISIPSSVTSVGDHAFDVCSLLATLNISGGEMSIGESAFDGCSALTGVNTSAVLTSIGEKAFNSCTNLISFTVSGTSSSMTSIGINAFAGCTKLQTVSIAVSVGTLSSGAFSGCSALKSVIISGSLGDDTVICGDTFSGCGSLETVDVGAGDLTVYGYAFDGHSALKTVNANGINSIGEFAFRACTGLTGIDLGSICTSIGNNAFYGCTALLSISIPGGVTSISTSAFENCTSLASVTLAEGVQTIEMYAFGGCSSLSSVIIPSSVSYLDYGAFQSTNLTQVTFVGSTTDFSSSAFDGSGLPSNTSGIFRKNAGKWSGPYSS